MTLSARSQHSSPTLVAAPATGRSASAGRWLTRLWNRGLPAQATISHHVIWPVLLLPVALLNQLLAPHPVWLVLIVTLVSLYGVGLVWMRSQAQTVTVHRHRLGSVLVVGDALREEFELFNQSPWPVLWAEFIDYSTLPGYNAGRVVGCGAGATYRWHSTVECRQRGVYRLGPHELVLGDPFGLFRLSLRGAERETVLIYPRVARLPAVVLPQGNASGAARRRRPLSGPLPSASVREHQAADSLRYVHWPLTAHRGVLMVKELEIEPSGGVWIVLDLNGAVHQTEGEANTLEFAVVVAASLAGELLAQSERRIVGLFTVSDHEPVEALAADPFGDPAEQALPHSTHPGEEGSHAVVVQPGAGPAQLWRILAALAPVQATTLSLAELLRTSHATLGRRGTVVIVTPEGQPQPGPHDWTAELLHLQSIGLASSVVVITAPQAGQEAGTGLRGLLARYEIPVQTLAAGVRLPSALTFRRTRKVVRNTPTGGAVTYEVEEEVG